jgi:hypothetical protein
MTGRRRWRQLALALILVAPACSAAAESATVASSSTSSSSTTPSPTTTTTTMAVRRIHEQAWTPFAAVGPLVLVHPSSRVEMVGFHESNHDGAQQMDALPTAAAPATLESRDRDNGPRGAADIVADPEVEIRAPVSGRVKRGGSYVLYCDHRDYFVVIEPDGRPGWEVKVLHIAGLLVGAGQHVEAGVTVIAPRPTRLPFASQVDELSVAPSWPHVHVEVIDPSIPDRPSPGC